MLTVLMNKLSEKNTQDQKYIDDFYENLCSIFVKSSEEAFLFQNTVLVSKNSETNKKQKNTLNNEQKEIVKKIKDIYNNFLKGVENPDPLKEQEHEKLKRDLRRTQRYNLFIKEQNDLNELDLIAKEKNRNKFWRFVKKSRKKWFENR